MFTPLEKILDEELLNECGITHLGIKFCPAVDFDETGNPYVCGTNAFAFIDRYNDKEITLQSKSNSYIENKDIQCCLKDLKIEPEKFWYLLLFVYDYCVDTCLDNIKTTDGAGKQIQKFIDLIYEGKDYYRQAEHNIFTLRKIEYDEPVELVLKIGKKKITITDSNTIGLIGILCNEVYEDVKKAPIFRDTLALGESIEYSDTAMAYLFCKMFRYYFDNSNHIKERRAEGTSISNKEKELLSYLLYFTGISKNKNLLTPLLNDYNTVKGFMNPKKKPVFKGFNNYY